MDPSLSYLSPRRLVEHLNRIEGRRIYCGEFEVRRSCKPLWTPFGRTKEVNSIGKYRLFIERSKEDEHCLGSLFEDDRQIGYLFVESGSVRWGKEDDDVNWYELIHMRLNQSIGRPETPAPLKIQVRATCEDYLANPTIERKDHVRSKFIWHRQSNPYKEIPTSVFGTDVGREYFPGLREAT